MIYQARYYELMIDYENAEKYYLMQPKKATHEQ